MLRYLLLYCFLLTALVGVANTIVVKNIEELTAANKNAKPGDIIVLQNGEWKNVAIKLDCQGTADRPIRFQAQTPGKVLLTGLSTLKIGGTYIEVSGLNFINGYAGDNAVISFRIDKNRLANYCRVTNTAIDDFNNPKRMDENNWVLFYGKHNQLDHCSFRNKKNMGVLLAVILDDDRSRENFHQIKNNYFGKRLPLASNGGEIIRVGVSQHCQFKSNTEITGNFFDQCDGETEIISIKSCNNLIEDNVFKESQGSLVLRHGDNNIVSSNLFIGNDKTATGGVRVINKGQVVRDNVFYRCRGAAFKAPIAVMNGIPNSPAHRYVQVTNAVISDNVFYECSPLSFCEGSDAERTLPPDSVAFENNIFYNTRDSIVYTASDDMKGFLFEKNRVSKAVKQELPGGFTKATLSSKKLSTYEFSEPLLSDITMLPLVLREANRKTGAAWFAKSEVVTRSKPLVVNCATADEINKSLQGNTPVIIRLTTSAYTVTKPFIIDKPVIFVGDSKKTTKIISGNLQSIFVITGNGSLQLENINFDGAGVKAEHFISSDSSGLSNHYNLAIRNCIIRNLSRDNGCKNVFFAYKYMLADSIVIRSSSFIDNTTNIFTLADEKENKGYYSAEKITIGHNLFRNIEGTLLNVYRGGNDESTLGPNLMVSHNQIKNCNSADGPLIQLTGIQFTNIFSNDFIQSNTGRPLIQYKDTVRARHIFERNTLQQSGTVDKNQFVTENENRIQ